MRQVLTVALAIITLLFVGGCKNAMSEAWKGDQAVKDDHNTPQTQKAADVAQGASTDDSGGTHNALTEGEDEKSRTRRDNARKSLGLGGG